VLSLPPPTPGVWEAGRSDVWAARGELAERVAVIDHPLFSRAIGAPEFHDDGGIVRRGDILRLFGVANEAGELDCRPIALRPVTMIAEVVSRERGPWGDDVFVVRGGKFPFVIVGPGGPLMPGVVARFIGVRLTGGRLRGIDEKRYLVCATVEVLPPAAKPALNDDNFAAEIAAYRWSWAVYDYHIVQLYALFGRDYVAEIAASPDKLDRPELRRWFPQTKERILRAAREVVRTDAAGVSTWVRDHWRTRFFQKDGHDAMAGGPVADAQSRKGANNG